MTISISNRALPFSISITMTDSMAIYRWYFGCLNLKKTKFKELNDDVGVSSY